MNKFLKNEKFIIGIDARFYGPLGKGLGRYTQEVVDNVINILNDNSQFKFVIFLSVDNFDEFICQNDRVTKVLVKSRWYTIKEQIEMPYLIFKYRISLMHFPHFNVPVLNPAPFVVTIHDLILTKFPTPRATTLNPIIYKLKNKAYLFVISWAILRSQKIITVSEFTKHDLISQFKVKGSKIVVTYEGVTNMTKSKDSLFVSKIDNKKTLDFYNIHSPFLLYIGNAYPHKNLENLVRVFSRAHNKRPNLRLVLVGREDYFYKRVKQEAKLHNLWQDNNCNTPIVFPGYIPDLDLETLFKEASCYIFPSLYEGFGLPPLEAMAHSCPVLSSNRASMPEILGDAASYFDPEDNQDILDRIEEILTDEEKKKILIEKGLKQVKKYSWTDCANATANVYKEILGKIF